MGSSSVSGFAVLASVAVLIHATLCAIQHREYLKAVGEAFNCATSTLCTYDELVGYCATAAGKAATIEHYDPKSLEAGVTKKMGFPFRETVRASPTAP